MKNNWVSSKEPQNRTKVQSGKQKIGFGSCKQRRKDAESLASLINVTIEEVSKR